MSEIENIHAGHRERMMEKVKDTPDGLLDYELLEILLFNMLPRINTNPLAHKLIKTFGSVEKVLTASVDELMAIKGVGEKTARQINFIGVLFNRLNKIGNKEIKLTTFETIKHELDRVFARETEEKFYLFLLNGNYKKIAIIGFSDEKETWVNVEVPDIAKAFATYKPKNVIIAHNHPSGKVEPSAKDDNSTMRINLLCMAHGITLSDHVIYAGGDTYSYERNGRLDEIKKKSNLNELLNKL